MIGQMLRRAVNSTLSNPARWFVELIGGEETASGVRIDGYTALTISAVWQAVNVIAGDVGQLPIDVYRREADGDKHRASEHPATRLLKVSPNPMMSPLCFKMLLQSHALLWGNGYAWIQRDSNGRPVALWPLLPDRTQVKVDSLGRVMYETKIGSDASLQDRRYRASNVLHIRGLGFDGTKGHSVVHLAADSMGMAKAAEKHGANYFKNFATPQGLLSMPGNRPSPEQVEQIKRDWKQLQSGDNQHEVAVLWGAMEFKPLSMSNKDSQFLESRQFQRQEIASWFNLPPHKVGDLSRATFSNIEEQNRDYLNTSLMRWLVTWQEECSGKLLFPEEQETHYCEFNTAALLRGDINSRYSAYSVGVQGGWLSRNEVRVAENLNRVEGLDEYLVQLNMGTGQPTEEQPDDDQEAPTAPAEETPADEVSRLIRACVAGLVTMEGNRISQDARTAKNYVAMVERFYSHFVGKLSDACEQIGADSRIAIDYCKESKLQWLALADHAADQPTLNNLVDHLHSRWSQRIDDLTRAIQEERCARNST